MIGRKIIYSLLLALLLVSCESPKQVALDKEPSAHEPTQFPDADVANLDFSKVPFKFLSEYGFFEGEMALLSPKPRVVPYEPIASLFTDYAQKSRFIWVPGDKQIKIKKESEEGEMDFPDQTILIKNFFYPNDFRKPDAGREVIETRLMVKKDGKWEAYPYVWNESQTEAVYQVIGGEKEVSWKDENGALKKVSYIIPNKNQCKSCHNSNEMLEPIGVKAMHLTQGIPSGAPVKSQLEHWADLGILSAQFEKDREWPSMVNYLDKHQSLDDKARSYLDINCGHCHRPEGPASTSGLFLTRTEKNASRLGVFKTPVAAGFGAGNLTYDIVPGEPEASILHYRMASEEVGVAMPEIGRVMVHEEGVNLIREWIKTFPMP